MSPESENQQGNPPVSTGWIIGICVLLAALIFIVFGQTLKHQFVNYDDEVYVYNNPEIIKGLSFEGIKWAFTHTHGDNWHPLTSISHEIDCTLYGLKPWGHHLTNVILHALAAVLLFLALRQMTGAMWRSAFVAMVFAIHPLRVESVAWVAERKDVLSGVFFMLTLWAYARYVQTGASRKWNIIVMALFAIGLMCKPTLVTLPFVLLLLDYWPLNRLKEPFKWSNLRPLVIEKIPLFVLSLCGCVATILAQKTERGLVEKLSYPYQIANGLVSYVVYIRQMFWPAGLVVLYPHPGNHLPLWEAGAAFLALALISWGVFVLRRKYPYLLMGWLWYLGVLVPMIGVVLAGAQAHADRYTYLPQIGLYIAIVWWCGEYARTRSQRMMLGSMGVAVSCLLAVVSYQQTTHWQDSFTLWTHTLQHTQDNFLAHDNMGNALRQDGRLDEAIAQYKEALRINPNSVVAHDDFGLALQDEGKLEEADAQFHEALRINPSFIIAHNNLAAALAQQGRLEEAAAEYREALRIDPTLASTPYNLGNTMLQLGRTDEAAVQYREAVRLNPNLYVAHNNLGSALSLRGKTDEAIVQFREAVRLDPDFALAQSNLADALFRKGIDDEAIAHARKALELQPDNVSAQNSLAWMLATAAEPSLRDGARALELATQDNRLSGGNSAIILRTLAATYAEMGDFPKALAAAQSAQHLAEGQPPNAALADEMRREIKFYEAGQPFRNVPVKEN